MLHYSSTLGAWVADWRHPVTGRMHHLVAVKSGDTFWSYFDGTLIGTAYETPGAAIAAAEALAVGRLRRVKGQVLASLAVAILAILWATSLSDATLSSGPRAAAVVAPPDFAERGTALAGNELESVSEIGATAAFVVSRPVQSRHLGVPGPSDGQSEGPSDGQSEGPSEGRGQGREAAVPGPAALVPVSQRQASSLDLSTETNSEYGSPFVPRPSQSRRLLEEPLAKAAGGDSTMPRTKRLVALRQTKRLGKARARSLRRMSNSGASSNRPRQTVSVQVRCTIAGRSERCWRRVPAPTRLSSRWVRCFVNGKSEWCRVGG